MLRKFRRINKLYARLLGYFWLPCPICGKMFGGHEIPENFAVADNRVACYRHIDPSIHHVRF